MSMEKDDYCCGCMQWHPNGCKSRTCFKSPQYNPNINWLGEEIKPIFVFTERKSGSDLQNKSE